VKQQLEIQSAADNFKSPSSRRAARWLIKEVGELTAEQRLFVDQLIGLCPDIGKIKDLAVSFRRMIMRQKAGQFETWLTKAQRSTISEFRSFAEGLKKDRYAILEALRSQWSNGQVVVLCHKILEFPRKFAYAMCEKAPNPSQNSKPLQFLREFAVFSVEEK
jgi:hypothetical protein